MMKRPDMKPYFRARIDVHVYGLMSQNSRVRLPNTVKRIQGSVTDPRIIVIMTDGTEWHWSGGQYAARKVAGCYAPLMPTPIATPSPEQPIVP